MLPKPIRMMVAAATVAATAMIVSCTPYGPRTIEYPAISFANSSVIDIASVELTDSCTILDINAYYRPNWWIKIASESYLKADGKTYALTGAEGIELDSEFYMPESGETSFKLFFEPLPFSTKKFDFIESDAPRAFSLWDVDLTGKARPKYPEGTPKELTKEPADGPMPEYVQTMGETTVNIHLLPYRPDFGRTVNMYLNAMGGGQQEYAIKIDSLGYGSVSFDQYGTAQASVVDANGYILGMYTLYPGEEVDCYIDMRVSGTKATIHRPEELRDNNYRNNIHTGRYSALDRLMAKAKNPYKYRLQMYTGDFADYHMTGEEYKAMVKGLYDSMSDSIAATDMPEMAKEFALINLQNDVLQAMGEYKYFLMHNYRNVKGDWRTPAPPDSIPAELTDADFAEVTTWFDTTNPNLLIAGDGLATQDWNSHGAAGDLSKSLIMYREKAYKARKMELTEADLDTLRTLSDPFYATACDSLNVRTKRNTLELLKNATVTPTPDVADDKVFDAIIAPHKGKVVVVYLWNTWCGPCRGALQANEPLKDGELSDADIVWIYIADETSDPEKYLTMIPDIKGIHYKVNDSQIQAIRSRFNVDGIPYYILVDRQGKAEGRPDLRDHGKYIREIKSKL